MTLKKPQILLLTLAITTAMVACTKKDEAAPVADAAKPTADAGAVKIDDSKLPGVNRFQVSDLDTTKDACTDFGGYVNGKWLAANAIPGDRTSWGAFEMLDERSTAVQKQLAEKAAELPNATGVDKIVGDFYASGMDAAKINSQGINPIKGELDAIAKLENKDQIADYLRASAAKGQNVLFGFGAEADFKDSKNNIAYASQGGLGLPDPTYYTSPEKKDKLAAYETHVSNVLRKLQMSNRYELSRWAADRRLV